MRGENPPAHSSKTALAAASSFTERGSSSIEGKVSTSTCVIPPATPSLLAFLLREQTCCNGGSPSITRNGLSRKSGLSRSNAWAGNSFAYRQAYSSARFVIGGLHMSFGSSSEHRSLFAEAYVMERHSLRLAQTADALPPRNVRYR